MQKTLFGFILKFSLREQILILVMTLVSFPVLYLSLDLPKTIVNEAIQGKDFPRQIFGVTLGQLEYLFTLCGAFLGLVLINGGFKYVINVYKGQVGERMLRRLRYQLYERIVRFPVGYFRKTPPGQMIPIITSEVEPLGGFIGDSVAVPAFQGGTLLTILIFMCLQDPILGLAAVSLYPFQMYVIPKLQRKVNSLSKQRIRLVRDLSDRINETAVSLREIHANAAGPYHLALFSYKLFINYKIRFEIFKWKFFVKFLNNFLAQLTPFFFYAIGGYLVIEGDLSLGALLAVVAAYKDLNAPWRELLDYYQQLEDARIKYEQVVEQFESDDMVPVTRLAGEPADLSRPATLEARGLVLLDESGQRMLDGVDISVAPQERVAVLGPDAGGKHDLAQVLAGLVPVRIGAINLCGQPLHGFPLATVNRHLAFVGSETALLSGRVLDNLLYGLKTRPSDSGMVLAEDPRHRFEAQKTGNSVFDHTGDWTDYAAVGAAGPQDLHDRIMRVLAATDLIADMRELGLRGTIDPAARPDVAEVAMDVRRMLREPLSHPSLRPYFEPFDLDSFNNQASVAENLLFGTPVGRIFAGDALMQHPFTVSVLEAEEGLAELLVQAGRSVARDMVEIFRDLPPDHEFYARFSFVDADELADLDQIEQRLSRAASAKPGKAGGALKQTERLRFIALVGRVIPARHRLDVVDARVKAGIVAARRRFMTGLPEDLRPHVEFFDFGRYNRATSLIDNMMFGRLAPGQGSADSRMRQMIREELDKHGMTERLLEKIIDVGLDFDVGVGGSRLGLAARQKLALARALMKGADVLVLDDPIGTLDSAAQDRLLRNLCEQRMLGEDRSPALVWVLQRAAQARRFDRVVVLEGGKLVETGAPDVLAAQDGSYLSRALKAE